MTRWNIFACELEDILADHGLRLSQLDDRTFIHREKVRRLRKSLERPKSFPVLNPDEMDEVISAIALDGYEVLRLRAAIVAASIQEMLVERIDADNALIAVEQMFPTIMMAMEQHQDEGRGIAAMRGGKDTTVSEKETAIEQALEGPLTIFDRATKAFHLSRNSETEVERFDRQQQAKNGFETVLMLLNALEDQVKLTDEWNFWHQEVQKSLVRLSQYSDDEV
jgi:hypothetical protein